MDSLVEIDTQFMTSVAFIAVTMALGELLRTAIRMDEEDSMRRKCLFEVAQQFEAIATTAEIVFVLGNYGPFPTYFLLVGRSIWQTLRWEPGKSGLGGHVLNLITGDVDWPEAMLFSSIEVFVAFLTYSSYVKPFWTLFDNQRDRWPKVHQQCESNMQGGLLHGSFAEGGGVFVGQFAGLASGALIPNPILRAWAATSIVSVVIFACAPISGSFFDPPWASAVQTGCDGVVFHEHLLCYWLAPTIGAILGAVLFLHIFGNPHEKDD